MFEPSAKPRFFQCPPGADFPRSLVDGLLSRLAGAPPEKLAQVEIFVNTQRMRRRILDLFDTGPAVLLPRIRLVTEIADADILAPIPPAVSPLRRRLEISQLVARLLDQAPDLAPRSSLFDLADSLALLLAEMHDEGVTPKDIAALDVADRSGHWQRSQMFLEIVSRFFDPANDEPLDENARRRAVVEHLVSRWQVCPPAHPVIVAGSTGSRGPTALLMQAVARLAQGAVILPGFDTNLPDTIWERLDNPLTGEDHPQFRFRQLLKNAGLSAVDVQPWSQTKEPMNEARNFLVSLALRPAPVTNQWRTEGQKFRHLDQATRDMSLIEAPTQREEAVAIALALRKAVEDGKTAALVTPDRVLTRRVRAALDRWRIEPDVSVGEPLDQTAPGRLLRHVADLFGKRLTAAALLTMLKHPLVMAPDMARVDHLDLVRDLELSIRRDGPAYPTAHSLGVWAKKSDPVEPRLAWANWVGETFCQLAQFGTRPLCDHLEAHVALACAMAGGSDAAGGGPLWEGVAGEAALACIRELRAQAPHGGALSPAEYAPFFHAILRRQEVRDPVRPHPGVMIWGTLEARVQGAELVILGGLNDGVWPEMAPPDPWLSREMRHNAGLLVPERRIGLSAHDFQQAIAAREVILSRALRSEDAPTVPSRWVNRLTNFLAGVSPEGETLLADMRRRGQAWLDLAAALETPAPVAPARRPAPIPPVSARPRKLPVTAINRLIRDPYAVYARYVLRLKPLDALMKEPDAPLRGTVMHTVLEKFILSADFTSHQEALKDQLLSIADEVLGEQAPWPAARILWRARLENVADTFLKGEQDRHKKGQPVALETEGEYRFSDLDFTLTAKADRIDRTPAGACVIYDYKTGRVPTKAEMRHFDKQLYLEAMLAELGGFKEIGKTRVEAVAHIGLGATPKFELYPISQGEIGSIQHGFLELMVKFCRAKIGFMSRRAVATVRFSGDYDHLARFGEWDETQEPDAQEVGS